MRKQLRAACCVGSVCVTLGFAGCMQTASPGAQAASIAPDPNAAAASYADLLRSKSGPNNSSVLTPKAKGATLVDSVEPKGTESVIYDQKDFGEGQTIIDRNPNPLATMGPGGITPAAFRVAAESGVNPTEGDKFQVAFENADINFVARAILGEQPAELSLVDPARFA